jgi:predicted enzyme related to lactoylglutathione lyase
MNSPIQNKIGMVFIPVSNMAAASAWYSRLFGLPEGTTSHEDRIYGVPMQGDVNLILDAHRPVANSSQPLCFFWTADIQAADAFLRAESITIARPVEDIGGLFTLTFQDPDGNLLMVCQNKAQ